MQGQLVLMLRSDCEVLLQEFVCIDSRVLDDNVLYAASRDGFSNELFHQQVRGFLMSFASDGKWTA